MSQAGQPIAKTRIEVVADTTKAVAQTQAAVQEVKQEAATVAQAQTAQTQGVTEAAAAVTEETQKATEATREYSSATKEAGQSAEVSFGKGKAALAALSAALVQLNNGLMAYFKANENFAAQMRDIENRLSSGAIGRTQEQQIRDSAEEMKRLAELSTEYDTTLRRISATLDTVGPLKWFNGMWAVKKVADLILADQDAQVEKIEGQARAAVTALNAFQAQQQEESERKRKEELDKRASDEERRAQEAEATLLAGRARIEAEEKLSIQRLEEARQQAETQREREALVRQMQAVRTRATMQIAELEERERRELESAERIARETAAQLQRSYQQAIGNIQESIASAFASNTMSVQIEQLTELVRTFVNQQRNGGNRGD